MRSVRSCQSNRFWCHSLDAKQFRAYFTTTTVERETGKVPSSTKDLSAYCSQRAPEEATAFIYVTSIHRVSLREANPSHRHSTCVRAFRFSRQRVALMRVALNHFHVEETWHYSVLSGSVCARNDYHSHNISKFLGYWKTESSRSRFCGEKL